jgi:hypothetical protein
MKDKKIAKKPVNKKFTKTNQIIDNKKPVGRPSKYLPIFAEQAKKLAMKGLIDKEIYDILGIAEINGIKWKKKYPEFDKALNEGKRNINQEVENKLIDLALGYEFDSEQIVIVSDGSQIGSHWERVPVKKRIEPNLGAIKEWSWNRNPNRWKNKQSIELSNENNEPFIIEIK